MKSKKAQPIALKRRRNDNLISGEEVGLSVIARNVFGLPNTAEKSAPR